MIYRIFRHTTLLNVLLAVGASLLTCACMPSSKDDPDVPDREPRCMLGLNVDLGTTEATTSRASSPTGPGYEPGYGAENFIATNDIRVYLFSTDNKLIAPLTGEEAVPVTEFDFEPVGNSGKRVYRMMFRIDKIMPDAYKSPQSFKIVVLANWGVYPDNVTPGLTVLKDIVESVSAVGDFMPVPGDGVPMAPELGESNRMPFYGVQEYRDIELRPGQKKMLDEALFLLRAYAKIDVYDHPETSAPITSVRLTRHNTKFYKAPLNVFHQDDYTDYDYDTDYVEDVSIPDASEESGVSFGFTRGSDGHFVAYVPEYKNIGRELSGRATITVGYGDGEEYTIYFKYYENNRKPVSATWNDPYDIRRNNWYKFMLRRKSEIELITDVVPYLSVPLDPSFGLDMPENPDEAEDPEIQE